MKYLKRFDESLSYDLPGIEDDGMGDRKMSAEDKTPEWSDDDDDDEYNI